MPPKPPPPRRAPARGVAPATASTPSTEGQASAGAQAEPSTQASSAQATPTVTPGASPAPSNPALQRTGSTSRPPSASPSVRGGGARGGRPVVAKPKFAGRRSQKSRAELEKEEADRRKEESERKAKEDARTRRRDAARSRGAFRGRQRGGYMGESERKKPDAPVMSGPFSLGQVVSDNSAARRGPAWAARSGPGGGGGGSGGGGGGGGGGSGGFGSYGGGGSGVKQEYGANRAIADVNMTDAYIKSEEGGYISSDDEDEGEGVRKRDVDELAVVDLTGDDDAPGAGFGGFAPVRIKRIEHKDRTIGLNADGVANTEGSAAAAQANDPAPAALSDKRKGKQRAKDIEVTGEQHKYRGVYNDSSSEQEQDTDPPIKAEPTDDDGRPKTPEPILDPRDADPKSPLSSPEARRKAKSRLKSALDAAEKPDFQTKEEQIEWELQQKDLRVLHDELGRLTTADASGDAAMSGTEQQPQDDPRADKVYLFQFPPVLPTLQAVQIKPDPTLPQPPGPAPMVSDAVVPKDGTAAEPAAVPDTPKPDPDAPTLSPDAAPSGRVGKLRIHKSGRATLDWGGTALEVGMGTEASFLQDVIIANFSKDEDGKVKSGSAMGMGQVKGKFVVTPDWSRILG